MIDFREEGPMTVREMVDWLRYKKLRKLLDLTSVASGYDPRLPEVAAFNLYEDSGNPERIYSHFKHDNQSQKNPEKKLVELPILGSTDVQVDRGRFIENWLRYSKTWKDFEPCRRLLLAWESYKLTSPHHDTKPKRKEIKIYMLVLKVMEENGTKTEVEAIRLLRSSMYKQFHSQLMSRATQNGSKEETLHSEKNIKSICSTAKRLLVENNS